MADWLPRLRQQPALWNAFKVLDTIVEALRAWQVDLLIDTLVVPVLDRAELLLREVLRASDAQDKRLEWGWLENRPASSLIGKRIVIDGEDLLVGACLARLGWLVHTLNPSDNHGFCHSLVRAYLRTGRIDDALTLCESYPDDFAATQYNHVLALFAAGRSGAALTTLRDAADEHPKPLAWWLKANPKPPAQVPWGVQIGGDDEARLYRCDSLALWQQLGAMEW